MKEETSDTKSSSYSSNPPKFDFKQLGKSIKDEESVQLFRYSIIKQKVSV